MFFASNRPTNLGIRDGKLNPCSSKPNCCCSQYQDNSHYVEPIKADASQGDAMEQLSLAVSSLPSATIITQTDNYIHAECKSKLLGFVDDLEVLWEKDQQFFQVRSASRLGYSDMGINRRRVEKLRQLIHRPAKN